MGELNKHDLQYYIDNHKCDVFIETGTGIGTGLSHALNYRFDNIYSIEIMRELYDKALLKFKHRNCKLICDTSLNGLATIIKTLSVNNILFWLDAHFPGADFQLGQYNDNHPTDIKLPIISEIELIFKLRPNNKDVFIIDDLNIYELGNYELGNSSLRESLGNLTLECVYNLVKDTHDIKKDNRHQGFLILTPKDV